MRSQRGGCLPLEQLEMNRTSGEDEWNESENEWNEI